MSDSVAKGSARQARTDKAQIVWFLGPRPASWNGVMKYSLDCIGMMASWSDFTVEAVDIDAAPRSFKRYWTQFVMYPLRAMAASRTHDLIVLYQEDMAFMIPFIKFVGGRVCIVMHHVQHPGTTRGLTETLKNWYVRLMQPLIARADMVVSTTDVTVAEALADVGVKADRIQLVPNAFDERFAPIDADVRAQARTKLLSKFNIRIGDELVLLNVGTDETRKNNVTVFRALAALGRKDLMILRVGKAQNATNRDECIKVAQEAGIKVHFVEGVSDEELGFFYQAADVYLSPTLQEGFGRTVIEAQLAGLPVLASDLPVYRYTMADTFLAVADTMNADAWGERIARLADDPALRQKLMREGRRNAERFSSRAVGAQLYRALSHAVQH
jgi:glycosyltransferase involved in cell wall biosynthesis